MRISTVFAGCIILIPACYAQNTTSATLPATAPTQSVSSLPSAQPQALSNRGARSTVNWDGVKLRVESTGEGLRNLLRQITRATGMKVTGGVPDEQVFGTYGPGTVQQVLADLFNGLSVNMMLVNRGPAQPRELLLTARTGGPTPASPSQPLTQFDDSAGTNPADANMVQPHPGRHTSPESFSQPVQNPASEQGAPPPVPLNNTGADGSGIPSNDANGQPQSGNGVRTPEQIFDELRKRQQQGTPQ